MLTRHVLPTLCVTGLLMVTPQIASAADHPRDLVDTAVAAGSFGTLVTAVEAAGLVATLKGKGPFTVFAPTDEAFARLPKATLQALLRPENRDILTEVLTYHVVAGEVSARQAAGLSSADTVAQEQVSIRIDGGQLRINDARVIDNDIQTSNGILHVIDSVLVPETVSRRLAQNQGRKVIGVYVSRPDTALASQLGIDRHESLLITGLTSGGSAKRAGVEKFDVITSIDGRPATGKNLDIAKSERRVGDEINLGLLRRGRALDLSVEVQAARH